MTDKIDEIPADAAANTAAEADLNEAELKDVAGGATLTTSLNKVGFEPVTMQPKGFEPVTMRKGFEPVTM